MKKLVPFAILLVLVLSLTAVGQRRKHKRIPIGTGTSAVSWEPEPGSAFLAYTRNLPSTTRVELRKITKSNNQVQVLSSKTLSGDEAERFAKLWRALKRGSGAGCFVPAYNLKFYSGESLLLDTEVCYGCDNLTLPKDSSQQQWGFDGRGPEGQALLTVLKFLL